MNFILDSLFIALVVLCIYLLYRLFHTRMAANKARKGKYAIVLPISKEELSLGNLKVRYELPEDGVVKIVLHDQFETELAVLLDEHQLAGNYMVNYEIPSNQEFVVLNFHSHNTKVIKKIKI